MTTINPVQCYKGGKDDEYCKSEFFFIFFGGGGDLLVAELPCNLRSRDLAAEEI